MVLVKFYKSYLLEVKTVILESKKILESKLIEWYDHCNKTQ